MLRASSSLSDPMHGSVGAFMSGVDALAPTRWKTFVAEDPLRSDIQVAAGR